MDSEPKQPKIYRQTCWHEKEHPNLGPVEFISHYRPQPCPVCGRFDKLTHKANVNGTG